MLKKKELESLIDLIKQDQDVMANRAIANTYTTTIPTTNESKVYAYLEKLINEEFDKILG